MKKTCPKCNQAFYLMLFIITFSTFVILIYINIHKNDKLTSYYNQNLSMLELSYKATIDKYNLLATKIYQENINTPETLNILDKAMHSKDELQRRYHKGLLYKNLSFVLDNYQEIGLRQLHFYLPNNQSFLRFHKPSYFGDDLAPFRKSVAYTNKNKKHINIFETGRVFSGVRNIFPITYNNEYIGSIEIGISLKSVQESLESLSPNSEYLFILNKSLIEKKLFDSQIFLYSPSSISPDFLYEDTNKLLVDSTKSLSIDAEKINIKLSKEMNLQKLLKQKKAFATLTKLNESYYDIVFLPLIGIENTLEGYLVSYTKTNDIPSIIELFPWIIISIFLFYALLILLLNMIRKKSLQVEEQKNWFLDVNNSLGDGMYVIDTSSNIIYINPMGCKILGYTQHELLGKSAHYMLHSHTHNNNIQLEQCPIFAKVKENGSLESISEYFQTKNGNTIAVEINAQALYKDGELFQIVTTFKDISIRKELEQKMKLLIQALESSSNTVVITDINAHVEWANPAFEKLTGYQINDVFGKQPKEFISSGKQTKEFYEKMWGTILDKKTWKGQIINKRKDGSLYHEELTITPVLNEKQDIQHFIAIKEDISDRIHREKNIEHFAYYDHLTNLPNRRLFHEHLTKILHSYPRVEKCSALLILDLDYFKRINDTMGHDIGDELLRIIAQRLEKSVRVGDIVSRFGGDEFAIILDNLSENLIEAKKSCTTISNKLLDTVRKPCHLNEIPYQTSISIGAYIFTKNEQNIDNLFKKADVALYEAKSRGRNTYHIFED